MRPAEQVWSAPGTTSLSLSLSPLALEVFPCLVRPTFRPTLLQPQALTVTSSLFTHFLLDHFILMSVYLLFSWAIGLQSGGAEGRRLSLCSFLCRKEFWAAQV